jgi:acyl-CoA reductase-like NAD-dependent aldehyde dehydrogenase
MEYIDKGSAEGGQKLSGVARDGLGHLIEPTVFGGLSADITIVRDNIFGPVLGISQVSDKDKACRIVTDTVYGLHAIVFTKDIDRAHHMARRLPCGTVAVNGFSKGDIKTPFWGYNRSGPLSRNDGTEGLDQYLQTKTIWISTRKNK